MSIDYAREKLQKAVYELATGPLDVRSRLYRAYEQFQAVDVEDLPEGLQKDYEWVLKELTRYEPRPWVHERTPVQGTLNRIHNSTGAKIAERIYLIYWQLCLGPYSKR